MLVANELRKTNIAEYLLYMWQVEDLIRANGFDADRLALIGTSGIGDESVKLAVRRWYEELIDMMIHEDVREKGHLQINNNILMLLADLHGRIMESDGCGEYKEAYYAALPAIVGYRAKSDSQDRNELESCFELMYGIWMLKLQGREISEGTADASKRVSALLARLAAYYTMDLNGELDLDQED
ncbi:MAG: DUF4924 family protein [Bacteroidaceae bacterium]|nr:DUF4924 family protein [Bacteroidaceae bacterium]